MFRPFAVPRRPMNLIKLDKLTGEILWCRDIRGGDMRAEWTGVEVHAYPDSDSHDVAVLLTSTFPNHSSDDPQRICHFEVDQIVGHPTYGFTYGTASAVGSRKVVCNGATSGRGIWQKSETGEWLRAPDFSHGSQIPPRCTIGIPQASSAVMYAVELSSDPPVELGVDAMTFVALGKPGGAVPDSTHNLPTHAIARVDGSGETVWLQDEFWRRHALDKFPVVFATDDENAGTGSHNPNPFIGYGRAAMLDDGTLIVSTWGPVTPPFDGPYVRSYSTAGEQVDSAFIGIVDYTWNMLKELVAVGGRAIGYTDVNVHGDSGVDYVWSFLADCSIDYQFSNLPLTLRQPRYYRGVYDGTRAICEHLTASTVQGGAPGYVRIGKGIAVRDVTTSSQTLVYEFHDAPHVVGFELVHWSWQLISACVAVGNVIACREAVGSSQQFDPYLVDADGPGHIETYPDGTIQGNFVLTAWDATLTNQLWSVLTEEIDQLVGDDDVCIGIDQLFGVRRYDPDTGEILWFRETSDFPGLYFRPYSAALSGRYLYLAGSNDRRP